jgi:hypothetical protein
MTHQEISYAIPPMIGGRREQPLLRIVYTGKSFLVEGKELGFWRPFASTNNLVEAFNLLHQANQKAMAGPPQSQMSGNVGARFG